MATALTVSLFLPNTVSFKEEVVRDKPRTIPFRLHKRQASLIDLPTRKSQTSLLALDDDSPVTPAVLSAANEQFFTPGLEMASDKPKPLVRSDTHVEWGSAVLNQPRSRAGPIPSSSIQDFSKYYEELKEKEEREQRRRARTTTSRTTRSRTPRASRAGSVDRGYEGMSWSVEPGVHGNAGLVNAMRAITDDDQAGSDAIDITWIGTIGFPTDALPVSTKDEIHDKLLNEYQSVVVYCSDKDIESHYAHYCKTILWPIFHYQVPDHPKSKAYADHSWKYYESVNQAFADKVVANYKRGDTIWIHDYHLLLVPGMVRSKLPEAKIGLFLHTAFPSSEVFRCLSTRKALLEGMLGANLIGFQTDEYAGHFLQTCSRLLTVETTAEGVQIDDHFVNVVSQPIGVNPPLIQEAREEPDVQDWIGKLSEKFKDKYLIVARDKLDNVHGVRQKLLAFELFLKTHPEWVDHVVMIQVATSTNEQTELLATVSDIDTRIGSKYSSLAHQPLVFLKQDIEQSNYLALLASADVLMISALRDGMNLTPHEFVLCQDGAYGGKKHAPIVLSEFTGAAAVLGQYTIGINPWNYREQANAIAQALEMKAEEKELRWSRLRGVVHTQTGGWWARQLNHTLQKVYDEQYQRASSAVPRLSVTSLSEKYKDSKRRIFIIDYEGTLAPHKTATGLPLGSPTKVIDTLNELMQDPNNIVYVMSGREPEELENHFRTLPRVGLIAENGCFLREYGLPQSEWLTFIDLEWVAKWKSEVKGITQYYQERLEDSYLEPRHCTLIFRYERTKDQDKAQRMAGECIDQINGSCKSMKIRAVPIHKAILIEQEDWTKETAAQHVFQRRSYSTDEPYAPDFLMVAGDDREDEVVFRWANGLAKAGTIRNVFTVTAGKRNTEAQASLTQGSTGLLTALSKLARISAAELPRDYFNFNAGGRRDTVIQ